MAQNGKLTALQSAATALVDSLGGQAGADANAVKMAVVPFSMTVNIGAQYRGRSWLPGVIPAAYGADIFTTAGVNRFTLFDPGR